MKITPRYYKLSKKNIHSAFALRRFKIFEYTRQNLRRKWFPAEVGCQSNTFTVMQYQSIWRIPHIRGLQRKNFLCNKELKDFRTLKTALFVLNRKVNKAEVYATLMTIQLYHTRCRKQLNTRGNQTNNDLLCRSEFLTDCLQMRNVLFLLSG